MEEYAKLLELGALGLINCILIFKGLDKMQALTNSVSSLSNSVTALSNSVSQLQSQTNFLVQHVELLENRLNSFETILREELHQIKFEIQKLKE